MAVKSAVYDYSLYTPDYYLKGFLAGGVCCSVTRCVEIKIHCARDATHCFISTQVTHRTRRTRSSP